MYSPNYGNLKSSTNHLSENDFALEKNSYREESFNKHRNSLTEAIDYGKIPDS